MKYICKIYNNSKIKKYYLNNILFYQKMGGSYIDNICLLIKSENTIPIVIKKKR